ncbi:MAG: DUF2339 domain-containing protein, partial [Chthoniobacterales bacterium]
LGLQLQFLLIALLRQRMEPEERWSMPAALSVGWASLGFGFWLLENGGLAGRPGFFFGFVFLADIGLLALALERKRWASFSTMAGVAVAVVLTWTLEWGWHSWRLSSGATLETLGWYLAFLLLFAGYPFFEKRREVAAKSADTLTVVSAVPWALGALAGVLHFWVVYELVESAYPAFRNGFLPALFVLPHAFGVFYLIRRCGVVPASDDARLAWQGGAALFFVSLIFPIQFEREWITLGWAVEGLALLVLFRYVRHAGLRVVGAGLLGIAFARLALNPAVLEYHRRAPVRIWNWYLYVYGIASFCFFAGARAVSSYRESLSGRVIPQTLYAQGAILLFVLLNIEIADYFSVGPTLTFSFEGNFAHDMTYSIAWALFAFALLLLGMRQRMKMVRYAGAGLLLVTLAKLFLHDFPNLGPLYRIGATVGVAIVMIVASFVYQRFLRPKTLSASSLTPR